MTDFNKTTSIDLCEILRKATDEAFNEYLSNLTSEQLNTHDELGYLLIHYDMFPISRLKALLDKGVDPNIPDLNEGNTALHWAVLSNWDWQKMEMLLEYGASPYIRNNQGHNVVDSLRSDWRMKNRCSCNLRFKCLACWVINRANSYITLISNYLRHTETLFMIMLQNIDIDIDEECLNKRRRKD